MRTVLFLFLLIIPSFLYSQTAPVTLPQPQDFPQYIVRPKEDLNPYGLSSLEESTVPKEDKPSTTFGVDQKVKSNIEVNEELLKRRKEKEKEKEKKGEETQSDVGEVESFKTDFEAGYEFSRDQQKGTTRTFGKTGIFRWVDENGVIHITNNLGAVPKEYMDKVEIIE